MASTRPIEYRATLSGVCCALFKSRRSPRKVPRDLLACKVRVLPSLFYSLSLSLLPDEAVSPHRVEALLYLSLCSVGEDERGKSADDNEAASKFAAISRAKIKDEGDIKLAARESPPASSSSCVLRAAFDNIVASCSKFHPVPAGPSNFS